MWVLYHDHTRGDQVLGARIGSDWSLHPMPNSGHDGWYGSGTVSARGTLLTASYDPSGFEGAGVIYGEWNGSDWTIELAASGSLDYTGGWHWCKQGTFPCTWRSSTTSSEK